MDYLLAIFILFCIVLFLVSFIVTIKSDQDGLRVLSFIVFSGILVIVIKYLFVYYGFSIYPDDYKYTWIIGLLIALIVFFITLISTQELKESGVFFMIALIFVTFIIGLHEAFIYALRNEIAREEVTSINYNFFLFFY
jgi:hypothetical protein